MMTSSRHLTRRGALAGGLCLAIAPAVLAQDLAAPQPVRGPVTNLPLPRYVSLKTSEGRARRGPNRSHRVDWVFTLRDMPLRVTAEFEHWRRVEDFEGQGGWMHYSLLSGVRTVMVTGDMVALRSQARADAGALALLEAGVVARILQAQGDWCRLAVEGRRGWVPRAVLWGVDPGEVLS